MAHACEGNSINSQIPYNTPRQRLPSHHKRAYARPNTSTTPMQTRLPRHPPRRGSSPAAGEHESSHEEVRERKGDIQCAPRPQGRQRRMITGYFPHVYFSLRRRILTDIYDKWPPRHTHGPQECVAEEKQQTGAEAESKAKKKKSSKCAYRVTLISCETLAQKIKRNGYPFPSFPSQFQSHAQILRERLCSPNASQKDLVFLVRARVATGGIPTISGCQPKKR